MDPGQLEEVVDHRGQPVGLDPDLPVVAGAAGLVVDHAVLERLGHRPQPGQRRAQVVRDPGDQVAAAALKAGLCVRDSASRCWPGQLVGEVLELRRDQRRDATNSPLAERAASSAATRGRR